MGLKEILSEKSRVSEIIMVQAKMYIPDSMALISTEVQSILITYLLAERFGIGMDQSRTTLKVIDQRGTRSSPDYNHSVNNLDRKFATNTLFADFKSISSNVAAQIYSHKCGLSASYPMSNVNGDHVSLSLTDFISEIKVISHTNFYGVQVQVGINTTFTTALRIYEVK